MEFWDMTQRRMRHKKKQPENKYSCISLLHRHTKVIQCPVWFFLILLHQKSFFVMLGEGASFCTRSI